MAYPGKQVTPTHSLDRKVGAFFCLKHATGMFLNGRRQRHFLRYAPVAILGLPRKIGNANTITAHESVRFSFCLFYNSGGKCPPDTFFARTILGLPGKIGNANIKKSQA